MRKQILLVEYDSATIETIQSILSSPIFEITIANEGETAKDLVKANRYDLVITAAMLPKFHGFNLAQFIGNRSEHTRIIIISGVYRGIEYKHQATTQYKAHDFFEKPLDEKQLKSRILELLQIEEKDLDREREELKTQKPISDTARIPTVKAEEDRKGYTSDELFGDMTDEEQQGESSYEIEIEDEKQPDRPASEAGQKPEPGSEKARRKPDKALDDEIAGLLKKEKKPSDTGRFKKIEDDISKKLEETLSGLGLSDPKAKKQSPPPPSPQKPDTQPAAAPEQTEELSDYDILGLIARGGMAEIYKAKKKGVKGFEKIIAIKKILSGYGEDDKYIEMFVDEAKIAAELSHPNIVQIYDLGKKDDYYFIAMEYVLGKDLRIILRKLAEKDEEIPEAIALSIIIKVLEALSYAHAAKDKTGSNLDIVHRDISPPNILISYAGDVKLTDFGVSKASIKIHQTISGALKGKLLYMSPEQAKGEPNIDHRSDLFSAGVILFELITGHKLFLDTSEVGVLKKVQSGTIQKPSEWVPDIDPELEAIILKALNKDRSKRYQSASEMIKAIETYMKNSYENLPTPLHIAHFLTGLFEKEIAHEGVTIDLDPVPFEIKKLEPEKDPAEETDDQSIDDEAPVVLQQDMLAPEQTGAEESMEEPPGPEPPGEDSPEDIEPSAENETPEKEKFVPTVEIDFDQPEPIREKAGDDQSGEPAPARESAPPPPPIEPREESGEPLFGEGDDMAPKKSNKRTIILSIILIVAMVAAGFYFLSRRSSKSGPPLEGEPELTHRASPEPAAAPSEESSEPPGSGEIPDLVVFPQRKAEDGREDEAIEQPPQEDQISAGEESAPPTAAETANPADERPRGQEQETRQVDKQAAARQPDRDSASRTTSEPAREPEKSEQQTVPKQDEAVEKASAQPVDQPIREEPSPPEVREPEVKTGQILPASQVDKAPVAVSTPVPRISKRTRRAMTSDQNLLVSILIDHNGNVEKVKLIRKSSLMDVNTSIIRTLARWKYRPATKNSVRVKIWKSIPITIKK